MIPIWESARVPFTLVVLLPLWGTGWMVTLQPDRLAVDGFQLSCGLISRACLVGVADLALVAQASRPLLPSLMTPPLLYSLVHPFYCTVGDLGV